MREHGVDMPDPTSNDGVTVNRRSGDRAKGSERQRRQGARSRRPDVQGSGEGLPADRGRGGPQGGPAEANGSEHAAQRRAGPVNPPPPPPGGGGAPPRP